MNFRMELTYGEIENIFDMKYIDASSTRYTFPPGFYEITDINFMLKSLLPDEVKVSILIDDNRVKLNLTSNKTKQFTKKSFFYTFLGCSQSSSGPLGDIEKFVQLIPGPYKNNYPVNILGID